MPLPHCQLRVAARGGVLVIIVNQSINIRLLRHDTMQANKIKNKHTPEYISDLLTSVANVPGRSILRASSCGNLAADTSTNWRQSLFCCCTASMEQATDGAETAAIDGLVSS